jgi:serine protease Do
MGALEEIQQAVSAAAEKVGPSVVGLRGRRARGSGVVVAPGKVLTTAHALGGDRVGVRFADGRRVEGEVAATDPALDLAVVTVDTGDAPVVELADVAPGSAGEPVLALARPAGRGLRVTLGFVSAAERRFRGPRGRRLEAIEHTAPLPPGSSGGPLVDRAGRLLGLNAVRLEGGLILALATSPVRDAIERLLSGEAPARRELGVAIAPPRVARRLQSALGLPERDGVLVRGVAADGPAARAGLRRGDLIVGVNGRDADDLDVLYSALEQGEPELSLTIVRGGEEQELRVALDVEEAAA